MHLREIASARLGLAAGRTEKRQVGIEERNVDVIDGARPADALLWNLVETVRLLDSTGVDYWLVRPTSGIRFTIGVRESQRKEIWDLIAGNIRIGHTTYARRVLPHSHTRTRLMDRSSRDLERQLAESSVIRLIRFVSGSGTARTFGEEYSTEIEFWDDICTDDSAHQFDDELIAPRPGATTRRLRLSEGMVPMPLSRATALAPKDFEEIIVEVPASQAIVLPGDIQFPIDVIYTWVDGDDPAWLLQKSEYDGSTVAHEESNSVARFSSRDELMYSLRSIQDFAPWVRHIYIVTADQHPHWLRSNDHVTIVSHAEIFSDPDALPTFNSHAIESQIHHIDSLSEHFIYLNDDMFFGRAVTPGMFYFGNGAAKHKLSPSRVAHFQKSELDTPVDQAVKNSRRIMEQSYGVTQAQVLEHSPYPLHRSVLQQIEDEHSEAVAQTASHRFRHIDDLNIPSHLAHHVAYQKRQSFPSNSVTFRYIGLHRPDLSKLLLRLLARRDVDTFCLNDTYEPVDVHAAGEGLREFLESYFPVRAPWEETR
ncbi:stealth family protein [Brachybacterium sp. AOP29-B2-41]|uniref:stealth family protein n=1 Tax=Brachybacterium sp. AOP29-B2-41 TaxID=3457704 RepID=UPI00403355EC